MTPQPCAVRDAHGKASALYLSTEDTVTSPRVDRIHLVGLPALLCVRSWLRLSGKLMQVRKIMQWCTVPSSSRQLLLACRRLQLPCEGIRG